MNHELYVGKILGEDRYIGSLREPYVIAEIGGSHDGNIEKAKLMINQAALAGVDCVKFQIFKTEELFDEHDGVYEAVRGYSTQFERMKSIELTRESFRELAEHTRKLGIHFSASPWDREAIDYLVDELKAPFIKIGSGDITALPLLKHATEKDVPIFISTAGATEKMISRAVNLIGLDKCVVMHCTFPYPTRHEDLSLYRMNKIKERFNVLVGYSDHTADISACVGAAYMGAVVLEKHFSTNKGYKCTGDHKVSAETQELQELVNLVKRSNWHKGDFNRDIDDYLTEQAIDFGIKARRSMRANLEIKKGEYFTEENIKLVRPENCGLAASKYYEILGKRAVRDLKKDSGICQEDLEQ